MPDPLCWLKPGDVYYGFGCGEDISFDMALAHVYGMKLRLFDPTPRAMHHVDAVLWVLRQRQLPAFLLSGRDKYSWKNSVQEISGKTSARMWFQSILDSNIRMEEISFRPWALGVQDSNMSFFEPSDGVSHSLLDRSATGKPAGKRIVVSARALQSIMAEFGDERIAVLKIDIEGYEIFLIPALIDFLRKIDDHRWPRILLFDMDSLRPAHERRNEVEGKKCVALLESAGYSIFSSRNFDYTFVYEPG